ncbi:MAG TPA: hypothetical protein O0X32_02460 [Methanocorpusculum sp.]|nr:hypothetical protein [Methanocorpusculum sp.]
MIKVTIIGTLTHVGSYVVHSVSQFQRVQEMFLFGRSENEQYLGDFSHDMTDLFSVHGTDIKVTFGIASEILCGSDIIVLIANIPRKADQTRFALALENARIVKNSAKLISRFVPDSPLLVVINLVDITTTVALKHLGLKQNQVFGFGFHMDSIQIKSWFASFFKVHVSEGHTRIHGEDSDSVFDSVDQHKGSESVGQYGLHEMLCLSLASV